MYCSWGGNSITPSPFAPGPTALKYTGQHPGFTFLVRAANPPARIAKRGEETKAGTGVGYWVEVSTGDIRGAGSTCDVSLQLLSDTGKSPFFMLPAGDAYGPEGDASFQRGSVDRFYLDLGTTDLGDLKSVRVQQRGSGYAEVGTGWFLQRVRVVNAITGEEWTFPCERWMGINDQTGVSAPRHLELKPENPAEANRVDAQAPQHRLAVLTAAACVPHPDKLQEGAKSVVRKNGGNAGEDAYFISHIRGEGGGPRLVVLGVADGVYMWRSHGIDAGAYARGIMEAARHAVEGLGMVSAVSIMEHAYETVRSQRVLGSCTMCVAVIDQDKGQVRSANLGDSGFAIVTRTGKVVYHSPQHEHSFGCPYQFGHHSGSNIPADAHVVSLPIGEDDIVVMGSDGLFDNVSDDEIGQQVLALQKAHGADGKPPHGAAARTLASELARRLTSAAMETSLDKEAITPYAISASEAMQMAFRGGKTDDITTVVAVLCRSVEGEDSHVHGRMHDLGAAKVRGGLAATMGELPQFWTDRLDANPARQVPLIKGGQCLSAATMPSDGFFAASRTSGSVVDAAARTGSVRIPRSSYRQPRRRGFGDLRAFPLMDDYSHPHTTLLPIIVRPRANGLHPTVTGGAASERNVDKGTLYAVHTTSTASSIRLIRALFYRSKLHTRKCIIVYICPCMSPMRCHLAFFLCVVLAGLKLGIARAPCPCDICPCFCECVDRSDIRLALVMHHREDDRKAGFQLIAGATQAARDRNVNLQVYAHDEQFRLQYTLELIADFVSNMFDGLITTLPYISMVPPLLKINAASVPLYIVGGTTQQLLNQLRAADPFASAGGAVNASIRHLGMDEMKAGRTLSLRLRAAGISRVICLILDISNVATDARCRSVVADIKLSGGSSSTLAVSDGGPTLSQLTSELESLSSAHPLNATAIVLTEGTLYPTLKAAAAPGGPLADILVVVYDAGMEAVRDALVGRKVVTVEQGYYTQGYLAVTLAVMEVVSTQMVSSDIVTGPVILSAETVTPDDVDRAACREEGFPVCGEPGVADVSPLGCRCFNRSLTRVNVFATMPYPMPRSFQWREGMASGCRDVPGTSYEWDHVYGLNNAQATARYLDALTMPEFSGIISFDHWLASRTPSLATAMRTLAERPSQPFYLAYVRDEFLGPADFLASYGADLFVGAPVLAAGVHLGEYARDHLAARRLLVNQPQIAFPYGWDHALGVILGLLKAPLSTASPPVSKSVFPDIDYFRWPVTGTEAAGSGVYSLFGLSAPPLLVSPFDGHEEPPPLIATSDAPNVSIVGGSDDPEVGGGPPPPAVVIESQTRVNDSAGTAFPSTSPIAEIMAGMPAILGQQFVAPLVARLREAPAGSRVDTVEFHSRDSFLGGWALQALDAVSREWGTDVRLVTHGCTATEFVALVRPGSVPGGRLLKACFDEQHFLTGYLAFTAMALQQHTGEQLLAPLETGRLLRAHAPIHKLKRRMECEVGRGGRSSLASTSGAGGDVAALEVCSGHGRCRFPTVIDNALTNATLFPSVGRCVCDRGYSGAFCEMQEGHEDKAGPAASTVMIVVLSTVIPVVLGVALCAAMGFAARKYWLGAGGLWGVLRHHRRRRGPPDDSQPITVVYTAIEGSAELWAAVPDAMNSATQMHNKILRKLLPRFGGYECLCDSDSFELAFHTAADALAWAMAAQVHLLYPAQILESTHAEGAHDWPPSLLRQAHCWEAVVSEGVVYRGLRVRMGVHTGLPSASYVFINGRRRYQGLVMGLAQAICAAAGTGGQVLVSMDTWHSLGGVPPGSIPTLVHNLGEHLLDPTLPPVQIMQVTPSLLSGRCPFPPIVSRKALSPSYYDAPGCGFSSGTPQNRGQAPKVPLVLMFVFVGGAKVLRSNPAFERAQLMATAFARELLVRHHGYECEEKEGNFLLAFHRAVDAAGFATDLQDGLMDLPWPEELLSEEAASEVVKAVGPDADSHVTASVFRGLRMKVGMYLGIPSNIGPHATTGRAAYYGAIINRAARIAATAANGQTLCNSELSDIIREERPDLISSRHTAPRLFPRTRSIAKRISSSSGLVFTEMNEGMMGESEGGPSASPSAPTVVWGTLNPSSVPQRATGAWSILSLTRLGHDNAPSPLQLQRSSSLQHHQGTGGVLDAMLHTPAVPPSAATVSPRSGSFGNGISSRAAACKMALVSLAKVEANYQELQYVLLQKEQRVQELIATLDALEGATPGGAAGRARHLAHVRHLPRGGRGGGADDGTWDVMLPPGVEGGHDVGGRSTGGGTAGGSHEGHWPVGPGHEGGLAVRARQYAGWAEGKGQEDGEWPHVGAGQGMGVGSSRSPSQGSGDELDWSFHHKGVEWESPRMGPGCLRDLGVNVGVRRCRGDERHVGSPRGGGGSGQDGDDSAHSHEGSAHSDDGSARGGRRALAFARKRGAWDGGPSCGEICEASCSTNGLLALEEVNSGGAKNEVARSDATRSDQRRIGGARSELARSEQAKSEVARREEARKEPDKNGGGSFLTMYNAVPRAPSAWDSSAHAHRSVDKVAPDNGVADNTVHTGGIIVNVEGWEGVI
eukprot:jgi/Mesvir1/24490/Mv21845-RA.1